MAHGNPRRMPYIAPWLAGLATVALASHTAHAQPAPQPAPPAGQPAAPTTPVQPDVAAPAAPADKPDPLAVALAPVSGGLTFKSVSEQAVRNSTTLQAKRAEREGAEGQVDQALVSFFPRLTLSASYTRLSPIEEADIGGGGAIVGAANAGPVTVGACPGNPAAQCVLDSAGIPVAAAPFDISFPSLLNQISFSAGLVVPVSDYFFRAAQGYSAASHNEEALKLEEESQRLQVAADAKVALLQWIQARGQAVVAKMSVEQVQQQLADAKVSLRVNAISQGDVMRIEANLAAAEQQVSEADAIVIVSEARLRTQLRLPPAGPPLQSDVDVFNVPAPAQADAIDKLIDEAYARRVELRAIDERRESLDSADDAQTAAYLPRLDAFADLVIANPNQRVFPQEEKFSTTWDVGVRLTWTVNDTFANIGGKKQTAARVEQLNAQQQQLKDAITVEVTQARADIVKATPTLNAAERGVVAAEEALRVTKKLFEVGESNATALVDAQTALTQARLRKLAAQVNLLAAQIKLDHALGRDRGK